MSALAADALAGIAVAFAPIVPGGGESGAARGESGADGGESGAVVGETNAAAVLAGGLVALGAESVVGDAPADLVVVTIDGADRPSDRDEPRPVAAPSLDAAADGEIAAALTDAFAAAREAFPRLRAGGCLLFVLTNASADHADVDPASAALGSLTRTLALEWAPERRVNTLICGRPEDAIEVAALIAWPASRTLTGAVLNLAG